MRTLILASAIAAGVAGGAGGFLLYQMHYAASFTAFMLAGILSGLASAALTHMLKVVGGAGVRAGLLIAKAELEERLEKFEKKDTADEEEKAQQTPVA